MPVTVVPSKHSARAIKSAFVGSAEDALTRITQEGDYMEADLYERPFERKARKIIQSSFTELLPSSSMISNTNGFVNSVISSYNAHYHLQVRPDDIWIAIVSQFSFHANAHAEELRDKFVAHKGKKALTITYDTMNRYTVDFSDFARRMTGLMEQSIVHPDLRRWIIPDFSTTTASDKTVASILMMCSLKAYFDFNCRNTCGFPSVTLLGEKEDYERILNKLEKLSEYGVEPKRFGELLKPVIRRMVMTFDNPSSPEVMEFWQRCVTHVSQGSGSSYYSGWITAFCFWTSKGECQGNNVALRKDGSPGSEFSSRSSRRSESLCLEMDGVDYPYIDTGDVPPAWGEVFVTIDDHGEIVESRMIAGLVGIDCSSSGTETESGETGLDTMRPQVGWWIFEEGK